MLCGFSSLWWPFGWNWSYLGFLGIIWRTCGSKCGGEGGGIFPTLCVECCLVVSGLNQCRTWNCFACYGIFSEVGTAILAGSVLQNLYYLSPSGAIVTSQWGHLVACGAGIALDREYQCRSLYGLENWAFITNACTNAKYFTCSKLNWNDVPRFMLPAVFY